MQLYVTCSCYRIARSENEAEVENEGVCRHRIYVANNCVSTQIDEYSSHTRENCMNCVYLFCEWYL